VPFKKEKCSDENTFVKKLPLFLNSLCPFIKCSGLTDPKIDKPKLITSAASVISKFASYGVEEIKNPKKKVIGGNPNSKKKAVSKIMQGSPQASQKGKEEEQNSQMYEVQISLINQLYLYGNRNLRGLLESEVPEALVEVLAANDRFSDYMVYIVEAISNCSLFRPIAQKFANMGVVKDLVQILSEATNTQAVRTLACIEAIWNILEVGSKEVLDSMALEEVAIGLKKIFEKTIREGYKLDDKLLRNELCILINYALNTPNSHQFFFLKDNEKEFSFFELLLKYASHDELILQGSPTTNNEKLLFTSKEEDTEFKKLLWTAILSLIKEDSKKQVQDAVIESKFINALLLYFNAEHESVLAQHRWQEPQLREMQLQALTVITTIISILPEQY
jgi:hypothetical protein